MPDEGSLPHATPKILISSPKTADKRSGGVSGALRGGQGRKTELGTQPVDSSLVTPLPEPWICSRIPNPMPRTPVLPSLYFPCLGFAPVSRIPSPVPRFSSHLSLSLRVRLLVRASARGRAA